MTKNNQILLAGGVILIVGLLWFGNTRQQAEAPPAVEQTDEQAEFLAEVEVIFDEENKETVSEVPFTEGETALDVTQSAFDVEVSGEGEMAFVTGIEGVTADSASEFWSLSVNGEASEVGAGSYEVEDGDVISWELTSFE